MSDNIELIPSEIEASEVFDDRKARRANKLWRDKRKQSKRQINDSRRNKKYDRYCDFD